MLLVICIMMLSAASRDCDGIDENVRLILVRNRFLWRAECICAGTM